MKNVYLFISSRITWFSKTIGFFTRSKYTHSALSINGKFDQMYSFGRLTMKMFPAGYVKENIRTNMLAKKNECFCSAFRFQITRDGYENMLAKIAEFEREASRYKYAVLGIFVCFFHIKKTFKYRRFCSQFVAELLQSAGIELPYDTSLMHPADFLKIDGVKTVYEGSIKELAEGVDAGTLIFPTAAE